MTLAQQTLRWIEGEFDRYAGANLPPLGSQEVEEYHGLVFVLASTKNSERELYFQAMPGMARGARTVRFEEIDEEQYAEMQSEVTPRAADQELADQQDHERAHGWGR